MNQRQKNKYLKISVHHLWCNPCYTIRETLYYNIEWCNKRSIDRFIKKYISYPDKIYKNGEIIEHAKLKYKW